MASSTGQFLSRTDHKKARELEEARKAGTLPAELDEEGKEINPHIPEFMARAPWYLNQAAPGLKHQKNSKPAEQKAGLDQWYVRGLASGPSATKFRKGACSNCGALTHAKADCLDRPRAKGARWTQADIRPDELLAADLKLNYDGKRDRFAGFDGAQYAALVAAKFSAEEGARKSHVLAQQLQALEASEAAGAAAGGDEDDGLRVRDDETSVAAREGGGTRQGAHKMSVRNLRIREDTAKYLLNLDANSAYYDPKTRSMRENPRPENPTPGADDADAGGAFVGDNFVRHRGETLGFYGLQAYTAEAGQRGQELHLNAEPTQVEILNKLFRERKALLQEGKRHAVLDKYGGEQFLKPVDARLLLAQSEAYTEYDRSGRARGGAEAGVPAAVRSCYEEDVLHTNHVAVWGSLFDRAALRWGYADDGSTTKHSYSTGEAGKRARALAAASIAAGMDGPSRAELLRQAADADAAAARGEPRAGGGGGGGSAAAAAGGEAAPVAAKAARAAPALPPTALYGIGEGLADAPLDKARLAAALARERARHDGTAAAGGAAGGKLANKRGYNSMSADAAVSAEDMEAYYMSKRRADDPMAQQLNDSVDAA